MTNIKDIFYGPVCTSCSAKKEEVRMNILRFSPTRHVCPKCEEEIK